MATNVPSTSSTPRLRTSVFGACVLFVVAAGLTSSVTVAAGEPTVPRSPAATLDSQAPASDLAEATPEPYQLAAVPVDAVRGEEPPAPPAGDEAMLEAHARHGAVVHLDDEGLLIAPTGATDAGALRAAMCKEDLPDRPRVTADRNPASAQTLASLEAVLAIMGCDVTGFRMEVDGATAHVALGAANREAEQRLVAAASELPKGLEVQVFLDEIRHG